MHVMTLWCGCRYAGKVAATQLETLWTGARDSDANIEAFAEAIADAVVDFMTAFYS